jgi:uncharacterized membrane protein YphA (DoxX/SURF4 family)
MMDWNKYQRYGMPAVRYGLAIVFLIFGIWQYIDPVSWMGYLPPWVPVDPTLAIYANATLDTSLGLLLALGLFTRIAGAVATLHLLGIVATLGFNEVAVRDIGLAVAALGVFFNGPDGLSLDRKRKKT